ncbi:MAG TPA: MlaD family protein [Thermoanaerobaculia bacterium]|nr:MlaD family protein [Thermoanaerobaculia bacterium]
MPAKGGTKSWRDLRLAIVVSAVAAFAVLAVLLIGTTRGPFAPDTYPLYLELDDAAGLRVGSIITVGGMAAGEVAGLEIVPRTAPRPPVVGDSLLPPAEGVLHPADIRLELAVQERFQRYVTQSSRAQLASLGLGGERYVKISAGDVREERLPAGATIEEIAPVDWDLILAKIARAANETQVIAAQMEEIKVKVKAGGGTAGRLLDLESALYPSLEAFADESEAMLDLLDHGEGLIPRYRSDPALRQRVKRLRADLAAIDSIAGGPDGALRRWAEPTELRQAVADLRADTDDLNRRLESGRGTLGRLLNDEELFLQIRVLQTRVAELVAAFRGDPLGFVNIEIF